MREGLLNNAYVRNLFRFEMAPGEVARIADVIEAIDLGRQIGSGDVHTGEIDPVDRQAG